MAVGEAAAFVSTLKTAWGLVDKLRASDDKEALKAGAGQLTEMLFAARVAGLALIEDKAILIDRVQELERKLQDATDFGDASGKYEQVRTPGVKFVYRVRGVPDAPYLCPTCYGDRKASILQPRAPNTSDRYHFCHVCKWGGDLWARHRAACAPERAGSRSGGGLSQDARCSS